MYKIYKRKRIIFSDNYIVFGFDGFLVVVCKLLYIIGDGEILLIFGVFIK